LGKALLEACEILRSKGDASYQILVYQPYTIGRELIKEHNYHPDVLYICGRSFVLNNRSERGLKYIQKAISMSTDPPAVYFLVEGDAYWEIAEKGKVQFGDTNDDAFLSNAKKAKEAYDKAYAIAEKTSLKQAIRERLDRVASAF